MKLINIKECPFNHCQRKSNLNLWFLAEVSEEATDISNAAFLTVIQGKKSPVMCLMSWPMAKYINNTVSP